jgi:hypothetical protein
VIAALQRAGAGLQLFAHALADRRVDRFLFPHVFLFAGAQHDECHC